MTVGGVVVLWLMFGLVSGVLGATRNVGFWLHATVGFLFGPVGILTALLFKPTEEATFTNKGSDSGLIKCPMCAELVKSEAKICKHCKSELNNIEPQVTEVSTSTEIFRLHQIQVFSDHVEVSGNRFESVEKAKVWIDSQ